MKLKRSNLLKLLLAGVLLTLVFLINLVGMVLQENLKEKYYTNNGNGKKMEKMDLTVNEKTTMATTSTLDYHQELQQKHIKQLLSSGSGNGNGVKRRKRDLVLDDEEVPLEGEGERAKDAGHDGGVNDYITGLMLGRSGKSLNGKKNTKEGRLGSNGNTLKEDDQKFLETYTARAKLAAGKKGKKEKKKIINGMETPLPTSTQPSVEVMDSQMLKEKELKEKEKLEKEKKEKEKKEQEKREKEERERKEREEAERKAKEEEEKTASASPGPLLTGQNVESDDIENTYLPVNDRGLPDNAF